MGREENAGEQHFLPFPQCFKNAVPSWKSKFVIVWKRQTAHGTL